MEKLRYNIHCVSPLHPSVYLSANSVLISLYLVAIKSGELPVSLCPHCDGRHRFFLNTIVIVLRTANAVQYVGIRHRYQISA